MVSRYRHPALRLLNEQLRLSPVERRLDQMNRAEQFYYGVQSGRSYPYPELCEKITGYRSEKYPDLKIDADALKHDLPVFVEDLSASANVPVEKVPEPVYTVEDLSRVYNVSTKTVDRWRKRGLVSRKFRFGKRTRVGFLRSSVDRFVAAHGEEIARGAKFSRLHEGEELKLLVRARELARQGMGPSQVARQVSEETGRAMETVRYTLKEYDQAYPETAIFPESGDKLSAEDRLSLYEQFRQGVPVTELVEKYGRTRTSIYRVVNEVRAEVLAGQPISFMDSDEFRLPEADRVILGPSPAADSRASKVKAPPGLPTYLASLYAVPLLTREQEQYYFRKMNYLRYKAEQLRQTIDLQRPRAKDLDRLEELLSESQEVKNFLIKSNLRLVVSIAKRHLTATSNFFEMVSDGNMSLIRAIEKFDYTKGNKFSTYATWAIMKNYARTIPAENKQLDRFRTGAEEVFLMSPENRTSQFADEAVNAHQHQIIMSVLKQLDPRERDIIMCRYGLERGSETLTLEQVGQRLGVTKERIRQLESRAMEKIRKIVEEDKVEFPGFE